MRLEAGQVCGWVSTTREMLARFVETHLPLHYYQAKDSSASFCGPCIGCLHESVDAAMLESQEQMSAVLNQS